MHQAHSYQKVMTGLVLKVSKLAKTVSTGYYDNLAYL